MRNFIVHNKRLKSTCDRTKRYLKRKSASLIKKYYGGINDNETALISCFALDEDTDDEDDEDEDDEGPSLETSNFSLYFSGSCIPINRIPFLLLTLYQHWYRPLIDFMFVLAFFLMNNYSFVDEFEKNSFCSLVDIFV